MNDIYVLKSACVKLIMKINQLLNIQTTVPKSSTKQYNRQLYE